MRNQLAHGYMTVDLKVVWNTVQRDIPILEQQVRALHSLLGSEAKPGSPGSDDAPSH